ncbi:spondin domain-containing protein [Chloroflexota bacterium]
MKSRYLAFAKYVTVSVTLLLLLSLSIAYAAETYGVATYRVTILNLSYPQPLSPPVAATHRSGVGLFSLGRKASPQLEALAEDGDQIQLYDLLSGSPEVTEVVNVGVPLTPREQVVGSFVDSATFEISARPGDRFSLATMLICTNDGFAGLDRVRLPWRVQSVFPLYGFDAGTENNTQMSQDTVDACTDLGRLVLDGDPDGSEDAAVDANPHRRIRPHARIQELGDLSVDEHGWFGPVGVVIVKWID